MPTCPVQQLQFEEMGSVHSLKVINYSEFGSMYPAGTAERMEPSRPPNLRYSLVKAKAEKLLSKSSPHASSLCRNCLKKWVLMDEFNYPIIINREAIRFSSLAGMF